MQLDDRDLRQGMLVRYQGEMCTVASWNILRNDRRAFIQMKLKNLKTGRVSELKVHDTKFEVLDNQKITLSHSYKDGNDEVFYTAEGEEYRCPSEAAADALIWKSESYEGLLVDGHLVMISLPRIVVATVAECDPPVKGGGNVMKEAKLDNGIVVRVGQLVAVGDRVKIDPETLEFKERA